MDELKPCPFCGTEDEDNETSRRKFYTSILKGIDFVGIAYEKRTGKYYLHAESEDLDYSEDREIIACPVCGKTLDRRPTPENKPLTLDQLRRMDGQPVWWWNKSHAPVCTICIARFNEVSFVDFDYSHDDSTGIVKYERWVKWGFKPYARKPEQEATT